MTEAEAIKKVLDILRGSLGLGEKPAGSNKNKIVTWFNNNVDKIGPGAWCEMTNTWAMWTAGFKELKKGRAYTVWACQDAQKGVNGSSWHWGTKGMRAGDQVYYDWSERKGNVAYVDHTGTVEKVFKDGTFYVLEGNSSDKLRRMHRDKKYVVGYVRFAWSRVASVKKPSSPSPSPATPSSPPHLLVDGKLGKKTITRWQQIMKTTADGVIDRKNSDLVRAVQLRLRVVDHRLVIDGEGIYQDGHRYRTVGALQRYLKSPVDEVLSVPVSECIKALQRRLNTGRF